MPKSQQSWVRSQHPPTQWNLRGGRESSIEIQYIEKKSKKIPLLNKSQILIATMDSKIEISNMDVLFRTVPTSVLQAY
jgi:hypothetical protein